MMLHSHLVSILSAFETTLINGIVSNVPSIGALDHLWIGAKGVNEDELFVWIDGNPMQYTNWIPGQPELLKKCVSTQAKNGGKWRTELCETRNYFICEVYQVPSFPCAKDVLMLIDVSHGIGSQANFDSQLQFLSTILIANWTVSCPQVEACPCVYDAQTFIRLAAFDSTNQMELQNSIMDARSYYKNNTTEIPSIKIGLELGLTEKSCRPGYKKVTLLLTSTSDQSDVNESLPYAAQLKTNGNTLIVIGMGPNASHTVLAPLASGPNFVFTSPTFAALTNNVDLANQINAAMCLPASALEKTARQQEGLAFAANIVRPTEHYSVRRPRPCSDQC